MCAGPVSNPTEGSELACCLACNDAFFVDNGDVVSHRLAEEKELIEDAETTDEGPEGIHGIAVEILGNYRLKRRSVTYP